GRGRRVRGRGLPARGRRPADPAAGARLMPVVSAAEIVGPACAAGRAAAAFNVIGVEHAEAIVAGAQQAGQAVILQLSENCVDYHGALAPIGRALLTAAAA